MMRPYKTAVVTGASSGIGAAIARKLAENGTMVYAFARSSDKLKAVQKSIAKGSQKNFMPIICDVSKRDDVRSALQTAYAKGYVDLVVCNAGIGYSKKLEQQSWQEIDSVIDTNLRGTLHLIKNCLELRSNHSVQFVCTTSLAGKIGFPKLSVYSATKFAIEGLVEALRNEYDQKDVSFTILRPGITATAFFSAAGMQDFENSVKGLKSYYSPDTVADVFLKNLSSGNGTIVVGNDKYFLALLPFIPFNMRFKVLDMVNKI